MSAIYFQDVWEKYRIKFVLNGREVWEDFWALKGINFAVEKGEGLAVIGENGAGKSTILKLIAGMLKADKGKVSVQGRISALLELGAGFHPEFTGRENLYLNASLFGMSQEDINSKFDEIVEFSGIGRFIDAQTKSYSQGMFVRLAFAVAIHMNPETLLIDDTLAVGDEDFQRKCIGKILELEESGKTIIFVTHDMNMARRLCKRGIFLRGGEIIKEGPIDTVISYYMETLGDKRGIAIIQKGALGAVFNNGKLILRWKDKALTKYQGGYSSFFLADHRFNSPTANWHAQVENGQRIIARGQWLNVPVVQVWDIRWLNDNGLQLKITLETSDEAGPERLQTEFLFSEEYKAWFSSEQEGVFPENFFHEREYELVHANEYVDKLSGIKDHNKEKNESLPTVVIDTFGQESKTFCQILNSGLDISARIIRTELLRLEQPMVSGADNNSIAMKLKFIENGEREKLDEYMYTVKQIVHCEREKHKWMEMEARAKKFTFEKDRFSVAIDENNCLHIYYDGKKLTKGPGIRASLLIGQEWQDSDPKEIRIERITQDRMKIYNVWKNLPIIQIWDLNIKETGIIDLTVGMEVLYPLRISEMNVSVFLADGYTKWFTERESGDFPDQFDKWEEVDLKYKREKSMGAISESLPTIVFDLSGNQEYIPHIFNTDQKFSAYVLQATARGKEYKKGSFEYFSGVIRITEEKGMDNGKEQRFLNSGNSGDIIDSSIFDRECVDEEADYILDDLCVDHQPNLNIIKEAYDKKKVSIGVSRFNFFKLDKLIKSCTAVAGEPLNFSPVSFNPFPVKTIYSNFIGYLKEIKSITTALGIKLWLKDKELLELLDAVSQRVTPYNERELLRILGIICEHAFIGPEVLVVDSHELDFNLYKTIIDDAAELLIDLILFQGNGEPLLDQRFWNVVEYARTKGIKVSFLTNGTLLGKETAKKILLDLDVEMISCNLPAATPETYALINPTQTQTMFNDIVENMEFLIGMRNAAKANRPILQMKHLIHALNYQELMQMAELDAQIGADKVQFYLIRPDEHTKHLKLRSQQIEMIKNSLDGISNFLSKKNIELDDAINFQLKYYNEDSGNWSKEAFINNGCPVSWFQSLISANSQVSICNLKMVGNLSKASLKEIWHSEKYHYYRIQAKHLNNNKDTVLINGKKLYDENCKHCDAHGITLRIEKLLKRYNLGKFI
ncbi:MAG: ATP-binding cassette domain-containing protein [Candidatus Omnitrophica bacterium]|nr:ATP-binding cassette domain-containing protein [Candidatus Omnitrophota bacterium]MCG2707036.1 ATP-binding cassette domain-containing protein [Candidatus Omnitrophota bacterium]